MRGDVQDDKVGGDARNDNGRRRESGQVLVIGLFVILGLAMVAITVANVGIMVAEKIHVQDSVDAAAYSAAVAQARYMNLAAYINRAIVANYNGMAFHTSLWAVTDSTDHGLAIVAGTLYLLAGVLQFIPIVNAAAGPVDSFGSGIDAVHSAFHTVNQWVDDFFAQDDNDLNSYIELYNTDILSTYSGVLFTALQSARYEVIQKTAEKMDEEILTTTVLGLGAETVSADEIAEAVRWVINEPDERDEPFETLNEVFQGLTEENEEDEDDVVLLGALSEVSLDKFTAGRYRTGEPDLLRNFNLFNIFASALGGWKDFIDTAFEIECYAGCTLTLGLGDCDCNHDTSIVIGAQQRWGQENKADEDRVPIIARQRMREVNFWGIEISNRGLPFSFIPGFSAPASWGHTSAERRNDVRNIKNLYELDFDRGLQCVLTGACNLNDANIKLSLLTGSFAGAATDGDSFFDDHWDGSYDAQPVCGLRYYLAQNVACIPDVLDYVGELLSNGFEEGVPKYDWKVDLDNVGFPVYEYDATDADTRPSDYSRNSSESDDDSFNVFEGPSIAVVGVKPAEDVNGLTGLGIGNDYSITAMARSQVYYLRSPERPKERPSLFNPHWVPRLGPIDSDASPPLLRDGLPYVGSFGVPVAPTH